MATPATPAHVVRLIAYGWTWAEITRLYPEITEDYIRTCLLDAIGVDTVHTPE